MKQLSLPLLLVTSSLALAGCAGSTSYSSLAPAYTFKAAQSALAAGGPRSRFALVGNGYPAGVGVRPPYYIVTLHVRRLPASTPVVVAKEWAEDAARGRTTAPLWGTTATLVNATATAGTNAGRTRTLVSNRAAWLVLMPLDQEPIAPGPFDFAGTKAVLIDANSGDYLEGVVLAGTNWR